MEITMNRALLKQTLDTLAKVIEARASLEVFRCVRIDAKDGGISFTGTDVDSWIEIAYPVDTDNQIVQSGSFVGYLGELRQALVGNKSNIVTLSCNEVLEGTRTKGYISSGGASRRLVNGYSPDMFPSMPECESELYYTMRGDYFKRQLERVAHSVSTDATRPSYTGIYMEGTELVDPTGERQALRYVTTDGYARLCVQDTHLADVMKPFQAIIRLKPLQVIASLAGKNTDFVRCRFGGRFNEFFILEYRNCRILSRPIEGNFAPYERVIPKYGKGDAIDTAALPASEFANEVQGLVAQAKSLGVEQPRMTITRQGSRAILSLDKPVADRQPLEILGETEVHGAQLTDGFATGGVSIQPAFLLGALEQCRGKVTIQVPCITDHKGLSPIKLTMNDDDRFVYVQSPMHRPVNPNPAPEPEKQPVPEPEPVEAPTPEPTPEPAPNYPVFAVGQHVDILRGPKTGYSGEVVAQVADIVTIELSQGGRHSINSRFVEASVPEVEAPVEIQTREEEIKEVVEQKAPPAIRMEQGGKQEETPAPVQETPKEEEEIPEPEGGPFHVFVCFPHENGEQTDQRIQKDYPTFKQAQKAAIYWSGHYKAYTGNAIVGAYVTRVATQAAVFVCEHKDGAEFQQDILREEVA